MKRKRGRKSPGDILRFIFFILAIIFLFIIIKILFFTSSWDGNKRISLVTNTDPVVVFSIEPKSKRSVLITFPAQTLLEVPYGYKSYPAASIFRLGELDKKRSGNTLLSKTVENTLGLYVDGSFSLDDIPVPMEKIDSTSLQQFKTAYFSWVGALLHIKTILDVSSKWHTNFSFLDLYKIWASIKNIRSDKIEILDLDDRLVLSDDTLPDGTITKKIDIDGFDVLISDKFEDQSIRSENVTAEVNNASGKDRLASQFARLLRMRGINVIQRSTGETIRKDGCTIEVTQKGILNSDTVSFLKEAYACKAHFITALQPTSDIKIMLGEEFYQ